MNIDRRRFIGGTIASGITLGAAGCIPPDQSPSGRLVAEMRIIEASADGMLGVSLLDTGTGRSIGLNSDRRFGHCSSFKMSLAAKVLVEDARGLIDADRKVTWTQDELLSYAPFTRQRLAEGATLRELAEFTQKLSDNTAANVLLRELGGPAGLTGFWRSIGDNVSRLDRFEPALNNVPVPEVRDTTTPAAMAQTVATLLYGDAMPSAQKETLREWMTDTQTGMRRVRAGLPEKWVAGDKTGTAFAPGMGSLYVDIGFVEPPANGDEARAPITFATYFRSREVHSRVDPASEAVLAKVGKLIPSFAEVKDWFPF